MLFLTSTFHRADRYYGLLPRFLKGDSRVRLNVELTIPFAVRRTGDTSTRRRRDADANATDVRLRALRGTRLRRVRLSLRLYRSVLPATRYDYECRAVQYLRCNAKLPKRRWRRVPTAGVNNTDSYLKLLDERSLR